MQSVSERVLSGVAGAAATTLVHETMRHRVARAPRMDVVGKRALRSLLKTTGLRVPRGRRLYRATLGAEIVSNAAFYALAGGGRFPVVRGALLGGLAGLAGVFLTPVLGLGSRPVKRSPETALMTTGWYLLGGAVAGSVLRMLRSRRLAQA